MLGRYHFCLVCLDGEVCPSFPVRGWRRVGKESWSRKTTFFPHRRPLSPKEENVVCHRRPIEVEWFFRREARGGNESRPPKCFGYHKRKGRNEFLKESLPLHPMPICCFPHFSHGSTQSLVTYCSVLGT